MTLTTLSIEMLNIVKEEKSLDRRIINVVGRMTENYRGQKRIRKAKNGLFNQL